MKYLVILLVLIGFVGIIIPTSYGLCVSGTDWDDVPCWGRICYDDSNEPACTDPDWWKERWEPYYNYKGKDWMESKKQELLDAIKSDSLPEWKKTTPNGTNSNVHDYYYYMGEVPNHYGVYVKQVFSDSIPPLKQIRVGITIEDIFCKENLVLIQKYDGSPACVTEQTKQKLIERGWALTELKPELEPEDESDVMKKARELGIDNIMEAVDSEKLTSDEKREYIKIRYEESPNNIPSLNIRIKDFTRNLEFGERPTFTLIETGYAIPCTHPTLEVYLLKQEIGNDHTPDDLVYEDKIVYSCPSFDSFYPVLKFWDETDFKPFPVCEKEGRYLVVGDSGYERGSLEEYYCNAPHKN